MDTKIKKLAEELNIQFNESFPITIGPDNSIAYKDYIIKQTKHNSWILLDNNNDIKSEFFLKTCAILAAKQYNCGRYSKYQFIRYIDSRYQTNYTDMQVYKSNIKKIKDSDQYAITLNKLEECSAMLAYCKREISDMFKFDFV